MISDMNQYMKKYANVISLIQLLLALWFYWTRYNIHKIISEPRNISLGSCDLL